MSRMRDSRAIILQVVPEEMREWNPETAPRSEEHTSELQSQSNLVCRLLLEKTTGSRPNDGPLPERSYSLRAAPILVRPLRPRGALSVRRLRDARPPQDSPPSQIVISHVSTP